MTCRPADGVRLRLALATGRYLGSASMTCCGGGARASGEGSAAECRHRGQSKAHKRASSRSWRAKSTDPGVLSGAALTRRTTTHASTICGPALCGGRGAAEKCRRRQSAPPTQFQACASSSGAWQSLAMDDTRPTTSTQRALRGLIPCVTPEFIVTAMFVRRNRDGRGCLHPGSGDDIAEDLRGVP